MKLLILIAIILISGSPAYALGASTGQKSGDHQASQSQANISSSEVFARFANDASSLADEVDGLQMKASDSFGTDSVEFKTVTKLKSFYLFVAMFHAQSQDPDKTLRAARLVFNDTMKSASLCDKKSVVYRRISHYMTSIEGALQEAGY